MLFRSFGELSKHGGIGDWCFTDNEKPDITDAYICFFYPVKSSYPGEPDNKDMAIIPIKNNPLPNGQCWRWDGNREAPTITPSVRVLAGEGHPDIWHGFMKAGKLVGA